MKKLLILSAILMLISCAEVKTNSPSETAKIVVESFYNNDNLKLQKHTTPEGYEGLKSIQGLITAGKSGDSNFEVLNKSVENKIAWIRFKTIYEDKPELFKLIKIDGSWKVTQQGPREKGPF